MFFDWLGRESILDKLAPIQNFSYKEIKTVKKTVTKTTNQTRTEETVSDEKLDKFFKKIDEAFKELF